MRAAASARYVLPALLVNAGVQALLVLPDPTPTPSLPFVAGAVISGIVALAAYAVIVATSVAPDARATAQFLRDRGARFALWTAGLGVIVVLGTLVLAGFPAYAVLALTPYVAIAAMSTDDNPVAANFAAIGRRPLGYVGRLALSAVVGILLFLQSALTTFFVGGPAATVITMTLWGLAGWWVTRMWVGSFVRSRSKPASGA